MPNYSYKAYSYSGKRVAGEAIAASLEDLRQQLSEKGLLVDKASRQGWGGTGWSFGKGVRTESFLLFNQEFIALLRAGIPIPEALGLVAERPEQPMLQRTLQSVLEDVGQGRSLSEACARHESVFDRLYVAALKVGEKSGKLASVLQKHHAYLAARHDLRQKLSKALAYPIFLLLTLAVVLAVLFAFVLPRFIEMYADFNARLPWPTRYLIAAVEQFYVTLPLVLAVTVLSLLLYRAWIATERGRLAADRIKLSIPLMGLFSRTYSMAQMTRMLSTLLASGMHLVETLSTVADSLSNRAFAGRLAAAAAQVREGESLAAALGAEKLLPRTALKLIQAGEAAGNLAEMLGEVARHHEQLLENQMARLLALIEPALMLLLGIFVGGIIVVMYLPIFSMAEVVQ